MNNSIYLVSAAEVKTICPAINLQVQDSLVEGAIILIQNSLVMQSLTQDFYDDLILNTGTTANLYLIEHYLKNLISYGVWQYLAVSMSLQLNDAGLRIKVSDHSVAAESVDLSFYRTYIQNFIDGVRKQMDRYISDHQADYPLYYTDKYGDVPVSKNFRMGRVGGSDYYDTTKPHWPCW